MTSYQLPVTNYQLPITSYQLPVTSYQLPITSYQLPVNKEENYANIISYFGLCGDCSHRTVVVKNRRR
ncbi:MAG: hypothetical protein AB1414_15060 [bacterium]